MASNIKGITIKISGETTELQKALKDVNKQVYSLNSDLKNLNQALKLDPKNTELLAQKQDVLKRAIEESTNKLNQLKLAQQQMGSYSKLTDEQKKSYNALSLEIAKTESSINGMNKELAGTSKLDFSKLQVALKGVASVALEVAAALAKVSIAIGTALAGAVAAGVKSYAELEQNIGGVETLFKENAKIVEENAKNAFKTAGVSANEYMAGVTSFSASLLQSLGGDTKKAAEVADMAFRDMSDNANKFGTDMGSIQNAYQGFAKQNYTMLDNLKLGYGGTKTEMERLLKDATKLSGVKYDIKNLNDVYEAIHVIQQEMGVTGTTAEEAEKTISGSFNSMKAALDNFLNGSGSPEALAETFTNLATNISNAIVELAPHILSGIVTLMETLIPQVAGILLNLLPQLMDAVNNLIDSVYNMILGNTGSLQTTISELIVKVVEFITTNLPKIIDAGIKILLALINGIVDAMPKVIPVIIDCIKLIVQTLMDNLSEIITAAIQIMVAMQEGMAEALPELVAMIPDIILAIVEALVDNLDLIIEAAIKIMFALIQGLVLSIPKLAEKVPDIIFKIIDVLTSLLPKLMTMGENLLSSLIQGILDTLWKIGEACGDIFNKFTEGLSQLPEKMYGWGKDMMEGFKNGLNSAKDKVINAGQGVAGKLKSIFHFSRPDEGPLRDYEEWMPDFMQGLANGINKNAYLVENAMSNLAANMSIDTLSSMDNAMSALNKGIESSLNPTINPNITIDTNYKMMALAMKEALKDMEVELDDREVGRFVVKTVEQEIYS